MFFFLNLVFDMPGLCVEIVGWPRPESSGILIKAEVERRKSCNILRSSKYCHTLELRLSCKQEVQQPGYCVIIVESCLGISVLFIAMKELFTEP